MKKVVILTFAMAFLLTNSKPINAQTSTFDAIFAQLQAALISMAENIQPVKPQVNALLGTPRVGACGVIPVSVSKVSYDLDQLDATNGDAVVWLKNPSENAYTANTIDNEIKTIENDMELIKEKRQEYQTAFENFDQKSNQLFNILSTVLKNMKDMESGIVRNML